MKEIEIKNWKGLVSFLEVGIDSHIIDFGDGIQFRGQSDYKWSISSSLSRIVRGSENSEKNAKFYERQTQMEFMSQAHLLDENMNFENSTHPSSILIDMQHYSCPTRLIDWTLSPYVALYFSVSENFEEDGALYAFDSWLYRENLKKKIPEENIPRGADVFEFEGFDVLDVFYATKKNHRIVRQQGCFHVSNNLLADHEEIINKITDGPEQFDGLFKIRIPAELKLEFLARLRTMNISAESLFPGLDGLGKSLRDLMLIRKWRDR
ncbi:FRG domain-containing protein [Salinimicrobium xinjiangense]|uniref:FRG domain-containing protein n=1 Tax=Salinimicrobium xinjiangense TaxID=438596 RepID=UPI000407060D|nr:FRG domain-containing protein [Salinimicrobium xinjiangense]